MNTLKTKQKQKTKSGSLISRCFSEKTARVHMFLFFTLGFLLPSQLGKHFFLSFSYLSGIRIDYLAPTFYTSDIIVIFLVLLNIRHILKSVKPAHALLFLVFVTVQMCTSFSPSIVLYRSWKLVEFAAVVLIVKNNAVFFPSLIAGLFFSTGYEMMLSLMQLIRGSSLQGIWYFLGERYLTASLPSVAKASLRDIQVLRPYGTFSHPNSLGGFYLLLFTFLLTGQKGLNPLFKNIMLILSAILVFISFSKAAIFTLIIVYVIYSFSEKTKCVLCTISRLISIPVAAVLFTLWQTDPLSLHKRIELAVQSFTIIGQHLVYGVGLGNYLIAQNQFPIRYSYFFLQPVHNIYLLWIAETGIFFGGVGFYLLVRLLWKNIKQKQILFVFLTVALTGFVDHYWITLQQNFLLAAVIIGMVSNTDTLWKKHNGQV